MASRLIQTPPPRIITEEEANQMIADDEEIVKKLCALYPGKLSYAMAHEWLSTLGRVECLRLISTESKKMQCPNCGSEDRAVNARTPGGTRAPFTKIPGHTRNTQYICLRCGTDHGKVSDNRGTPHA